MSDTDLVMQRLAEADPAPVDEGHMPDPAYSVLFDTICERSEGMQTTPITPWWRRGPVVAIAVFVLVVSAGAIIFMAGTADSSNDVVATTEATDPPTTTVESTTTSAAAAARDPHQDALALWGARYGANADPTKWLEFLPDTSPAFEPIEWDWLEDFDGDGVVAFADWMQFQIAMNRAMGVTATTDCETVSPDMARCVVDSTDVFYELRGVSDPPREILMTFEDGKLVNEERAHPSVAHQLQEEEASDEHYWALGAYQAWVLSNYPSHYPSLFQAPCCEVYWVTLPSTIAQHEELMVEYLDSLAQGYAIEIVQGMPEDPGVPFTATGVAVDDGVVCPSGTTEMFNYQDNGQEQPEVWDLAFTCDDGSGTFTLQFSAFFLMIEEDLDYSGGWTVIGGTGAYDTLAGNGRIEGGSYQQPDWTFFYTGEVRLEE